MIYTQKDIDIINDAEKVSDLPDKITDHEKLDNLQNVEIPNHIKGAVDGKDLKHREFDDSFFWQRIPYLKNVSKDEFMDPKFQNQNSVTKVDHLDELLEDLVDQKFLDDVHKGMEQTPMNLRLSPYIS